MTKGWDLSNFQAAELVTKLAILLVGLVMWVVGTNVREWHIIGVDVGETISHLGFLIAVIVSFHWIFESRIRNKLIHDIIQVSTGSSHLAESGVADYIQNAKRIDYSRDIVDAHELIVCVHYSPRFLEDNYQVLAKRTSADRSIKLLALKDGGASLEYLLNTRHENDHIKPNIRKIRSLVEKLKNEGVKIELIEHDSILRYSFVKLDNQIWIKFYKNSVGMAEVPALNIRASGSLYTFFENDIRSMVQNVGR